MYNQIEPPKYFAIFRNQNNPLWQEYIDFLNKKCKNNLGGHSNEYYGISMNNGLSIHFSLKYFGEEAVELTLEEWYDLFIKPTKTDNMKKEFPKYFVVSGDDDRKSPLWNLFIGWMNFKIKEIDGTTPFTGRLDNFYGFDGKYTSKDYIDSFLNTPQLITIQEWYDNIYKTDKMEKEIVGYIAPYDINDLIKKGDILTNDTGKQYCKVENRGKGSVYYLFEELVETWQPIYKTEEVIYTMGVDPSSTFQLVVKDGKCFHIKEDITDYVKAIQSAYAFKNMEYKFAGYDFNVQDMIISKSGCKFVKSLLSQWLAIKL